MTQYRCPIHGRVNPEEIFLRPTDAGTVPTCQLGMRRTIAGQAVPGICGLPLEVSGDELDDD